MKFSAVLPLSLTFLRSRHCIAVIFLLTSFLGFGQTLTISDSGQTGTSGTNWSVANNTIKIFGDHVDLSPSVIEQCLLSNDLTIEFLLEQGSILINSPIRSNSANLLRIISKSAIVVSAPVYLEGGEVYLSVLDDAAGKILIDDEISTSSFTNAGGDILIEATEIVLHANAKLAATGPKGGGNILVGGDWQGGVNPQDRSIERLKLKQAIKVMMEQGATIDVSAIQNGNGGKAVLWSDVKNPKSETVVHGTILAKGGPHGGDGGQIETSGAYLDIIGSNVSASAANGAGGDWLLDPYDWVIGTQNAGIIETALDGGTNVNIVTTYGTLPNPSTGSSTTDILRNNDSGVTGTDNENGDITVNSAITSTGSGSLILNAIYDDGNGDNAQGDVIINALIRIGGSLIVKGINIDVDADINTSSGNGNIYLEGSTSIQSVGTVDRNLTSGAGNITIISNDLQHNGNNSDARYLTVNSTGILTVKPYTTDWSVYGGQFDLNGTYTSDDFSASGDLKLNILNVSGLSGLTIGKEGISAGIRTYTPWTIAGNINFLGDFVAVDHDLEATANGANILLKANKRIILSGGTSGSDYQTIQTNNGDITLWANSANSTSGGITVGDWVTFNTANGSTTQSTGGGDIWFAGGSVTNADGRPTGPAIGTGNNTSGIGLGSYTTGATTTSMYSGGGDVFLSGESSSTGALGVSWNRTAIADAGSGTITIKGVTKNLSSAHGIELGAYDGSIIMTAGGGNITTPGILLEGSLERIDDYYGIQIVDGSLTATGTGGITAKSAKGSIYLATGLDITTNGGDLLLWTNTTNVTSGNAHSGINLAGSNTVSTAGGKIVLAGGLDNGGNGGVAGDGIPDGFVYRGGIAVGAITIGTNVNLLSGGGDVIIRGQQNGSAAGVNVNSGFKLDSGTGTISIYGKTNKGAGVGFDWGNFVLTSASTAETAISIKGEAVTTVAGEENFWQGVLMNFNSGSGAALIQTTGVSGGGIEIIGNNDGGNRGIWLGENDSASTLQILSKAGDISLISDSAIFIKNQDVYLGNRKDSTTVQGITPAATNSNSDILIRVAGISDDTSGSDDIFISTTGSFTYEPYGTAWDTNDIGGQLDMSGSLSSDDFTGSNSDVAWLNILGVSGLTGLTIGKEGMTSSVASYTPWSINGPISFFGATNTVNNDLTSTASGADILVKGSDNITVAASTSVVTDGGDVTLWSNSDSNGGYIYIQDNVTIDTRTASDRTANNGSSDDENGGAIILGGGAGTTTPTGYAVNSDTLFRGGINLGTESNNVSRHDSGISFISGGGNITLKGQQTSTSGGDAAGINAYEGFVLDAGKTGNITLIGDVSGSSASYSDGMNLGNFAVSAGGTASYITTVDGDITLTGTSGSGSAESRGVILAGGGAGIYLQSTGTGTINISGTSGGGSGDPYNILFIGAHILANNGDINLLGGSAGGTVLSSFFPSTVGYKSSSDITSSNSDITVTADKFDLTSGIAFNTAGTLTIKPTNGNSFLSAFNTSNLTYSSDVSGLTVGHSSNTGDITVGSATTIAGEVTLYGSDIAINGALTATSSDINLHASGAVTQSAALTANRLALNGAGTFTLQNSANNVATIAGGDATTRLGNVAYRDADALEIDTVNPTGIFSSGTVLIETESGDLTLSQNINTTSTSDDAIILNAGRASAAGTATGGNILVSGSPTLTYGSGGRAKLFSGTESASTGLTALAGGAANVRQGFDEDDTISPTLADDNTYAIYRLAEGAGDLTIVASGGDAENSTWKFDSGTRTLTTIGTPVDVNASVVEGYLASGDLTIEAGNIEVQADISSSASNTFTLKALGKIEIHDNTDIETNGGDLIVWANSDNLNGGNVLTGQNVTLDSRQGGASTGGGRIHMGGGADTNSDGFPDDATAGIGNFTGGAAYGILFGNAAGSGVQLLSGGGDITLIGGIDGNFTAAANAHGIGFFPGFTVNANAGDVTFNGYANSGNSLTVGIDLMTGGATNASSILNTGSLTLNGESTVVNSSDNLGVVLKTGLTVNAGTVNITGDSDDVSVVLGAPITATGAVSVSGGNVSLSANINTSAGNGNILLQGETSIQATGSDRTLNSGSGDITIITNDLPKTTPRVIVQSTGTFTMQPFGTAFSSFGQQFDLSGTFTSGNFIGSGDATGLQINNVSQLTGLVFGKEGNTTGFMTYTDWTVNGPISFIGRHMAVSGGDIISSASGQNIVFKVLREISVDANRTIQSNNGDIIFWADSDADAEGYIAIGNDITLNSVNGLTTSGLGVGGNIVLAGGADDGANGGVASDGIPDGFASNNLGNGIKLGTTGDSQTLMYSGGGDIILRGKSTHATTSNTQPDEIGVYQVGIWTANSGTGAINIDGESQNFYGVNFVFPTSNGTTGDTHLSLTSSKTSGDAVKINGLTAEPTYGVVFNYDNPKEIISNGGGNIKITGTGGGSYGVFFQNQDVLATSGTITIEGNEGILTRPVGVRFGAKSGSAITSSSADVLLIADNLVFDTPSSGFTSEVRTTGTLTVEPTSNSFGSALTFPISNFDVGSTVSGLTLGKSTNTANVTMVAATSIAGPISVYGGNISVNQNLTSTANGADILLKGLGNIVQAANRTISTNGGDITLWADTNENGGYISLANGTTLDSRTTADRTANNTSTATGGGTITLGGGSASTTLSSGTTVPSGYALYNSTKASSAVLSGIQLGTPNGGSAVDTSISLYSGGGDIVMRGQSTAPALTPAAIDAIGLLTFEGISVDAGLNGDILLDGKAQGAVSSQFNYGLILGAYATANSGNHANSSWRAHNGSVTINGLASGTVGTNLGLILQNGTTVSNTIAITGSGDLNLSGSAATGSGNNRNFTFRAVDLLAATGDINITGASGGKLLSSIAPTTIGYKSGTSVNSSSGNITITNDLFELTSGKGLQINSTGKLTLKPFSTNFSSAISWPIADFSVTSGLTGLILGKANSTTQMTIASAQAIDGPITIYGGTIALNAALTATNDDINLHASGNVTQTAALTADGLGLNGTGNFTLTNASNNVATIAGGDNTTKLGSLSFTDASGGLTVGTVNPTGIYSSGAIEIATLSGDLEVTQPIVSTLASGDAVKLYADKDATAGNAGDGNIKITGSGSVTVESGARALLYSGKESESTGLQTAVGGSANTRIGVDANTNLASLSPALASTGKAALFRVRNSVPFSDPSISTEPIADLTYSGQALVPNPVVKDGSTVLVKDTDYTLTYADNTDVGTATVTITGTGAYSGTLTATFSITKKALTITGISAEDKAYDGTLVATLSGTASLSGVVSGEDVSLAGTPTSVFADSNVGAGLVVTVSGYTIEGDDVANYTLTQPALTAAITKREITITPTSGLTKVYGDSDPDLTYAASGLLAGETPSYRGELNRAAGQSVGTYAIDLGGLTLTDNGAFKASNYQLAIASGIDFTITKAPLTVTVNDDSKFVTQSDTSGYAGVSYTGFKFGEDATALNTSSLVISRTNSSTETAGNYEDVLQATGIVASNYTITYETGDYVIVAADQLLVKLSPVQVDYGTTPVYTVALAAYYDSDNAQVVDLTSSTAVSGDRITVTDGASGSAAFTVSPDAASYSSASELVVDRYDLQSTNQVFSNANNFSDTLIVQGVLTVDPKELTVSLTSSKTKTYDGNTALPSLTFNASTVLSGDQLNVNGNGDYSSKDVGTTTYSVSGLTLSGDDAANYYIQGGASASISGSDGQINAATLTVSPRQGQSKLFGASDPVLTYDYSGEANGETPAFTGSLSRSAGETNGVYPITLGTLAIVDNGAFKQSNYQLSFTTGVNFSISSKSIAGGSITVASISDVVYNGNNQEPTLSVKEGSTDLILNTDYELSYSSNKNVGTAIVTITGKGNYSGTLAASFEILPRAVQITAEDQAKDYGSTEPTLTYSANPVLYSGDVFTGALSRQPGEAVGTYPITIGDLSAGANYTLTFAGSPVFSIRRIDSDGDGVPDDIEDSQGTDPNDPNDAIDTDGDGVPDYIDAFPNDPNEDTDTDGDGVGDNADAFPNDPNEDTDTDGDGVGDNADAFPNDPNEDTDTDGDGVGDNADAFPNDPTEDTDTDGDGVGDNADAFPNDPNEDTDSDGDGVGDNADAFPNDADEGSDTDGDGIGDNSDPDIDGDGIPNDEDAFPYDPNEDTDTDGDGVGDNADAFPNDPNEDTDSDGDGVGDNADAFPNDPNEDTDTDGDGVGDNADAFPNDPNEDTDSDGDGVGDNADPSPFEANAYDDTAAVSLNEPLQVMVLDNDDFVAGADITLTHTGGTAKGSVSMDATSGALTYMPLPEEAGTTVTVTYQVCHKTVCATATVTLEIEPDTDGDGIGDSADPDDDNDGVEDIYDQCPGTPPGTAVDINGCALTTVGSSAFSVAATSVSCTNIDDGVLTLTATDTRYSYAVTVSGQTAFGLDDASGYTRTLTGLPAGSYQVCFTPEELPEQQQCYTVTIGSPTPLQLSTQLIEDSKQLKLTLQGAASYTVELNGVATTHTGSSTELKLKTGLNRLRIYTDQECQGVIEKEVFVSEVLEYAPNPVINNMQLYIGGTDREVTLTLSNLSGGVLFTQTVSVPASRIYSVDLGRYSQGTYILQAQGPTVNKTIKVIKR